MFGKGSNPTASRRKCHSETKKKQTIHTTYDTVFHILAISLCSGQCRCTGKCVWYSRRQGELAHAGDVAESIDVDGRVERYLLAHSLKWLEIYVGVMVVESALDECLDDGDCLPVGGRVEYSHLQFMKIGHAQLIHRYVVFEKSVGGNPHDGHSLMSR